MTYFNSLITSLPPRYNLRFPDLDHTLTYYKLSIPGYELIHYPTKKRAGRVAVVFFTEHNLL